MSLRALLLVAATAVAPAPHGCRVPSARLEVLRFEAARPELLVLRCRASGFRLRPRYAWKLPTGVRAFTSGEATDEDALQVQVIDGARGALDVECTALDEPDVATARVRLGAGQIKEAKVAAGQITVDGGGFGEERGSDDAVWLIPGRGAAVRADHDCKSASWSDGHIVACLPRLAQKNYQVRVESGARLLLGPPVTLP
jgi:hypothetical protein